LRATEDFANQRRYENYLSKGTFGWQANSQLLNRVAAECEMVVLKFWKTKKLPK
jgi:hypothetical protein